MNDDELDTLKELIATWARRPPRRSAAAARTRVLAGLAEPTRSPRLVLASALSAVVVLMVAMFLLSPRWPFGDSVETAAVVPASARQPPVLVYELSSGTTLYLTLTERPVTVFGETRNERGEGL